MFFKKSNPSIHNNFLFKNVPPSEIPIKVRDRKFSKFKEGEIIYSVGDNSNFVYLLVKGQIKIKNYDIPEAGSIFEKSDDDYFGEIEFLNKTSRKTTAMAVKKSVVYLLDHKDINNLKKNKTIYSNLFNSPFIAAEPVQPAPNENIPPTENEYESNTDTASDQNNNELIDKSAIILNDEDEAKNVVTAEALESLLNDEVNVIDSNIDNNLTEDSTIKFDYTADDFIVDGNLNQQPDKNAEKTVDESIPRFDTGESVDLADDNNSSLLDKDKIEFVQQHEVKQEFDSFDIDETPVLENPNIQSSTKYGSVETYKEKEGYSSVDSYREIVQNVTKSISDEIRTSLDLIRKYSLQLKEKISDEETQTILQKILDETTSISRAIQAHEDFLSEKINLNAQIYFAEPVLSDIIRLLEGYTEFRGVKLSGKFEADSAILIDKNLFFQAMLQVVKIMCEEIQENGNINITIKRANSSLILELVNTASKLPENVLGCINRQVLISDNPGLNYAKNIIREHGGIMSAWNNLNEGSQINIKIPVVK